MVVRHQGIVWESFEKIGYPRHFTFELHIALGGASSRIRFADPRGPRRTLACATLLPATPQKWFKVQSSTLRLNNSSLPATSNITRNTSEMVESAVKHSKMN